MGGQIPNVLDNSASVLPQRGTELGNSYYNQSGYMDSLGYGADELGGVDGINSMFDMPGMDMAKIGIGGINSIAGLLGTIDTMKTNKIARTGMEQNQKHAGMARDDRTNFLSKTEASFQPQSAFA